MILMARRLSPAFFFISFAFDLKTSNHVYGKKKKKKEKKLRKIQPFKRINNER